MKYLSRCFVLILVSVLLTGCGDAGEAKSIQQDELEAYMQANPEAKDADQFMSE